MTRCFISLGGNQGAVDQTFDQALARLAGAPGTKLTAVSRYFRTEPVGDDAGGGYLNAAAEIETILPPFELLDLLQAIEAEFGRTRTIRWGPRSLDLDLLFYGSELIATPRLVVPHRAAWYRRFVLDPLVEIAPRFVHPERAVDITALRDRLLPRPLEVLVAGGTVKSRTDLIQMLTAFFRQARLHGLEPGARPLDLLSQATLIFWLGNPISPAGVAALEYSQLPTVSRLDVTAATERPVDFARHVLQSALG